MKKEKKKKESLEEETITQPEENNSPDNVDSETDNQTSDREETKPENESLEQQSADQDKEEKDPIESLQAELNEQKDKYIRLMAEFDNYKRRTGKEYERLVEMANERLMTDIIEIRESFERALVMAKKNDNYTTFIDGMKLIFNKLEDILGKHGLSVFTEIGDEFNPEIHDALMKTAHPEIPEDHITEIYEKGYKLKKHVIKHAKVIVSSGKPEENETSDNDLKDNQETESEKQTTN